MSQRSVFIFTVYVVFGAAGAVGSSLVERLAAQPGAKVVASDRDGSGLETVESVKGASLHPADTEDEAAVGLLICTACHRRVVFHLGLLSARSMRRYVQ